MKSHRVELRRSTKRSKAVNRYSPDSLHAERSECGFWERGISHRSAGRMGLFYALLIELGRSRNTFDDICPVVVFARIQPVLGNGSGKAFMARFYR
jgi:hypothetical protein